MSNKSEFTDEELTAYLDGEKDYVDVEAIEKAIAKDPSLRQRIEQLTINRDLVKDSFNDVLLQAPDFADNKVENKRQLQPMVVLATAVCLCIGITIGIGWKNTQNDNALNHWHDYVAAYQALYINNTLSHLTPVPQQQLQELERVGSALGKSFELTQLQQHAQLEYKRGQILGFEGRPLIQLAFLSSVGEPVALCIMKSGIPNASISKSTMERNPQIHVGSLESMAAAHWQKDGFTYLLIGGTDELLITDAAEHFFETI